MFIIENGKFFDVDGTLIINDSEGEDEIRYFNPNQNCEEVALPYWPNINLLKRFKDEGHSIVVWSHSGARYSKEVIYALGLQDYVDFVMDKPQEYIDDEDCGYSKDGSGHQGWMGQRIWLAEGEDYID